MYTKIHLFTPIQNTEFALSCEFDTNELGYNDRGAFGVLRFTLFTPDGTHWRKVATKFNENGMDYVRKLCVDTYEYASIVDKTPDFKSVEKELCDSVCMVIGRTVRKHFNKKEA